MHLARTVQPRTALSRDSSDEIAQGEHGKGTNYGASPRQKLLYSYWKHGVVGILLVVFLYCVVRLIRSTRRHSTSANDVQTTSLDPFEAQELARVLPPRTGDDSSASRNDSVVKRMATSKKH